MPLLQMFHLNPVIALSVCLCLATICWCILVLRRLHNARGRFLVGLVGLLAIHQGLHLLKDAGFWTAPSSHRLENMATLVVASLSFISILILELQSAEFDRTKRQLRLTSVLLPHPHLLSLHPNPKASVPAAFSGRNCLYSYNPGALCAHFSSVLSRQGRFSRVA